MLAIFALNQALTDDQRRLEKDNLEAASILRKASEDGLVEEALKLLIRSGHQIDPKLRDELGPLIGTYRIKALEDEAEQSMSSDGSP